MKTIMYILLFTLSFTAIGQAVFTDAQLKEDLEVIKTTLVELSPNYTKDDKEKAKTYFDEQIKELSGQSMTVIDFFKYLTKLQFNSKLDGHGQLEVSQDIMTQLIGDKKVFFPMPILIFDNAILVNTEESSIPFGSKITAINNKPISDILSELLPDDTDYSISKLEPQFDVHFFIRYGVPEAFNIQYSLPNSENIETVTLDAFNLKERETAFKSRVFPLNKESFATSIYTKSFDNGKTYYLKINAFNWHEQNKQSTYENFNDAFEKIFKAIKKEKANHLVIDLRDNQGGDILIPGLLYSFIANSNFNQTISATVPDLDIPNQELLVEIANKPITNQTEVADYMAYLKKNFIEDNGSYKLLVYKNPQIEPHKNAYNGTVSLLVSGKTFSAAAYFTALFKNYNRGDIIGETVGGSHHNVTAGQILTYKTPNSGIKMAIPIQIIEFSEELKHNVPEKNIKPTIMADALTTYNCILNKQDVAFKLLNIDIN